MTRNDDSLTNAINEQNKKLAEEQKLIDEKKKREQDIFEKNQIASLRRRKGGNLSLLQTDFTLNNLNDKLG